MSVPKKQHYVPQVYLRNFTDKDSYYYVFDKSTNKKWRQTPSNSGYSKHFYTVEVDGEKDYFIEKLLAEKVDSLLPEIIVNLQRKKVFNEKDRKDLATFLAFQYLRTPAQRKNYNRMIEKGHKRILKLLFSMEKYHGLLENKIADDQINSIEHILNSEDYEIAVSKEGSLKLMLEFADEMIQMLSNHNIIVLEASSKSEFITTDNPYCMVKEKWSESWSGYGVVNTAKFIPLTPKLAILLKNPGKKMIYVKASKSDVRVYNKLAYEWADKYIFCRIPVLLDSLTKNR